MARTIDKVRAELPGGNLGAYFIDDPRSISAYVLHRLRIGFSELREAVADASDDAEIERWLLARIDPGAVGKINEKLVAARIDTLSPEERAIVAVRHPVLQTRTDLATTFDMLEADDAATFPEAVR